MLHYFSISETSLQFAIHSKEIVVFGDKFYKKLHKLMPWQQTLFALALSERMYPNYCLYAESTGNGDVTDPSGSGYHVAIPDRKKYAGQFVCHPGTVRSWHA